MNAKNNAPPAGEKKPDPTDNRTAEQREEDDRWEAVKALVRDVIPAIKKALPSSSDTDPIRFAQLCLTVVKKDWNDNLISNGPAAGTADRNKALIWASDYSIQRCIVQAAELDLQPGSSLGHCFFIRRGYDCTFQIGVWGYVTLMRRAADVAEVWSEVIYEKDRFRIVLGLSRDLEHEIDPLLGRSQRGRVLGAYAVVKYRDDHKDWLFVSEEDLERAKEESKAKGSPAYTKWPDEMRKRTALKRLAKYVDKSPEANRAADLDESDDLREDLAEAIRTITVQGETIKQEVSKQKSTLDAIMANGGGPALPPHVAGQSAREQLEGAQRNQQGAEVAK